MTRRPQADIRLLSTQTFYDRLTVELQHLWLTSWGKSLPGDETLE
ncbi:hypothetical protein [Moorena producens]